MKEGFRQSMSWLHTWAGLIFGWLLFAIFLTGTLSYFKEEINHWAKPEVPVRSLDTAASLALAQGYLQVHASGSPRWFINVPDAREPVLRVGWQDPGKPGRAGFMRKNLDPQTGAEVQARESRGGDFFYRFHFELQMGYPWGRWLSSIAAMVMFVGLISGIIVHKKLFKEFFTFRPGKGQRSWLDGHNALGVLVLPFHLMITYSSLVIFMTMVMPASIVSAYGDNTQALFKEMFPARDTPAPAGQPAPLVSLPSLYAQFEREQPGARLGRVEVLQAGDVNARVVMSRHNGDQVSTAVGAARTFDGVSGKRLDSGTATAPMVQASGTFYGLHMGQFAGPWLRWGYFLFGLGGTAIIGTGLIMWLGKRQLKHAKSGVQPMELRLVEVLNIASMAGLLLAIVSFLWANRLLPSTLLGRSDWEINSFFLMWGLALVHAALRPGRKAWAEQLAAGAILYALLPVLNGLTTDRGLWRSIPRGDWAMAGVDLTALATGLVLAWSLHRLHLKTRQPARRTLRTARTAEPIGTVLEGDAR